MSKHNFVFLPFDRLCTRAWTGRSTTSLTGRPKASRGSCTRTPTGISATSSLLSPSCRRLRPRRPSYPPQGQQQQQSGIPSRSPRKLWTSSPLCWDCPKASQSLLLRRLSCLPSPRLPCSFPWLLLRLTWQLPSQLLPTRPSPCQSTWSGLTLVGWSPKKTTRPSIMCHCGLWAKCEQLSQIMLVAV